MLNSKALEMTSSHKNVAIPAKTEAQVNNSKIPTLPGSKSSAFSELLLGQSIAACRSVSKDLNPGRAMADAMMELQAADPLAAALMSQALSVHFQAMQMMGRSDGAQSPEVREQWLKLATKLMTLFSRQIEALCKYQRKGSQSITIRHVHLGEGSNAVIGAVNNQRGGLHGRTE